MQAFKCEECRKFLEGKAPRKFSDKLFTVTIQVANYDGHKADLCLDCILAILLDAQKETGEQPTNPDYP